MEGGNIKLNYKGNKKSDLFESAYEGCYHYKINKHGKSELIKESKNILTRYIHKLSLSFKQSRR